MIPQEKNLSPTPGRSTPNRRAPRRTRLFNVALSTLPHPVAFSQGWEAIGLMLMLSTLGIGTSSWAAQSPSDLPQRSPSIQGTEAGVIEGISPPLPEFDSPELTPNLSFGSQRLNQQIRLYADYLAVSGVPDILIVGSSRSLQGMDPLVLQQSLAARGYGDLKIYNFGVNGATAQVVDLVLRRILTPNQLPRLVIWADGSRAFNSARPDVTFNSIVASQGYQQLAAGVRPIRDRTLPAVEAATEFCIDLPPTATHPAAIYSQYLGAHQLEADPDGVRRGDWFGIEPPTIADWTPYWERFESSEGDGSRQSVLESSCLLPDSQQRSANPVLRTPIPPSSNTSIPSDLTANGFQSVPTEFNPATYYRQFPRVAGRYDNSYTPFRLEGEQTTAAIALATFARNSGVALVFVNLPLSQEYLDPTRRSREQQFRQYMEQLARREEFLFRDLMPRWSTQNSHFADPSHLNRNGARAVAQYLATDSTIPWLHRRSATSRQ